MSSAWKVIRTPLETDHGAPKHRGGQYVKRARLDQAVSKAPQASWLRNSWRPGPGKALGRLCPSAWVVGRQWHNEKRQRFFGFGAIQGECQGSLATGPGPTLLPPLRQWHDAHASEGPVSFGQLILTRNLSPFSLLFCSVNFVRIAKVASPSSTSMHSRGKTVPVYTEIPEYVCRHQRKYLPQTLEAVRSVPGRLWNGHMMPSGAPREARVPLSRGSSHSRSFLSFEVMQSSPSAGPPESKPKRGLAKLTFKTRSKNNQAAAAPQLTHRSSIHRKTSMARKDSRRQSRLAAGKRNSKRVSLAQKRISVGSKISGRSHSPATPVTAPANVVYPIPAPVAVPPPRAKSGGGLLRRLTRHFTTKKTPAPPAPVPVPARLAAKFAPPESRSTPAVPAIVQPPASNPQSRAGSRAPTPAAQTPRAKSPAPSTASKNRSRAPSPDRISLASWRYPPLPPSPIPPSPSLVSPAPPFSPSLSSPSQPFGPVPPSPGYLSDSWGPIPPSPGPASLAPESPALAPPAPESSVPAPPAPAPDSPVLPPALAVPEPEPELPEPQGTVEHESPKSEAQADFLASPLELEVPAFPAMPPTPALVQSDTESSAGHQMPLTPTMPPDEDDSQVSRGRRPRRKDTPLLLIVPGGDSDAPPSLMEDDEDAWTDDEGAPVIASKEHLPVVEEPAEIPRVCSTPERRPLTVIVPPSGGLAVTVDVTSSPTEMTMEVPTILGTPTILEPANEGDDDEDPSNPRWSQAPKTGGIEFILPPQPAEDAPLKTSQSDKPRSQTLDPNSGGGLRPAPGGAMRRSTTFSKIFNFGSKKDLATLSPTSAEPERRPSADRKSRGMSMIRGPSRLEVEANRLPTRAPTVYAMSNAELADQLENLRTMRTTMNPGTHTPTVVDDETARVTELAYF
ncbi:hypothetical protein M407DRAFT_224698 [Tulasnella calospora MUT 4182]|uniref:Uncharacterized protein n=1 Tax=Tulasnella calospora MUT 4182 TaxID=1051891 RepID=A0A0C3L908_9AGAM|nr:hypothetical protein M407DRAFT_224698 [Tulasnella calospora MUT 4182]